MAQGHHRQHDVLKRWRPLLAKRAGAGEGKRRLTRGTAETRGCKGLHCLFARQARPRRELSRGAAGHDKGCRCSGGWSCLGGRGWRGGGPWVRPRWLSDWWRRGGRSRVGVIGRGTTGAARFGVKPVQTGRVGSGLSADGVSTGSTAGGGVCALV